MSRRNAAALTVEGPSAREIRTFDAKRSGRRGVGRFVVTLVGAVLALGLGAATASALRLPPLAGTPDGETPGSETAPPLVRDQPSSITIAQTYAAEYPPPSPTAAADGALQDRDGSDADQGAAAEPEAAEDGSGSAATSAIASNLAAAPPPKGPGGPAGDPTPPVSVAPGVAMVLGAAATPQTAGPDPKP
jgi:hypothetical protein